MSLTLQKSRAFLADMVYICGHIVNADKMHSTINALIQNKNKKMEL